MKKFGLKAGLILVLICACVLGSIVLADPGTDSDPLISKSYIDNVLVPKVQQMINSSAASSKFVVVEVPKGKQLICSAGTELILRMGQGTVIATAKGGLADTTSGIDLVNGKKMPPNHLLIVPVADGRGIKADTNIIVMVKGGYTLK